MSVPFGSVPYYHKDYFFNHLLSPLKIFFNSFFSRCSPPAANNTYSPWSFDTNSIRLITKSLSLYTSFLFTLVLCLEHAFTKNSLGVARNESLSFREKEHIGGNKRNLPQFLHANKLLESYPTSRSLSIENSQE